MAKVIESYPQLSCKFKLCSYVQVGNQADVRPTPVLFSCSDTVASRMLYQGRWWETLELDHPILKFVRQPSVLASVVQKKVARLIRLLAMKLVGHAIVVRSTVGRFP